MLVGLLVTLLPSWNLGFAADDYENLVESTAKLPLTSAFDGLHRPLRNLLFKGSYLVFGLHSAPYHLGLICLHLLAVIALWHAVRCLGGGRLAAFVTAPLFGFFPRNQQAVFWVSAGQDSVITICALVAVSAFVRFKQELRARTLLAILGAVTIALGFKETAIAIFPLLVLVDLTCGAAPIFRARAGARIYLPLIALGLVYLLWFKGYLGHAAPPHFYGVQSFAQTLKLLAKFGLNMLFPFGPPLEVKNVLQDFRVLILAGFGLMLLATAWRFVRPKTTALTTGWFLICAAPTAVLGFYTDRYLGLPFIGLAMFVGFGVEGACAAVPARWAARSLVAGLIIAYLVAAIFRLLSDEELWRTADRKISLTMNEIRRRHPVVPKGSVFYFVDLPRMMAGGQVYVFNTGLNGMFIAWGYDPSVTARRTINLDTPRERSLAQRLLHCPTDTSWPRQEFIFVCQDTLQEVSGRCAEEVVAESLKEDPELWQR